MLENWQTNGFGVYVHWPFCAAKCPYCDFNSHVTSFVDHSAWRRAYTLEIERSADLLGSRVVSSIFFGGGTPSLMEPQTVELIIDQLAKRFSLANDVEITLEANPSSVESGKFANFQTAGVNRVSLGIQSLYDEDLKRLGRLHSAAEAYTALEVARTYFKRVSFDLIYARQHQSPDAWSKELSTALSYEPDHLSLYQLTIEDGTAFGDRFAKGSLKGLPNELHSVEMYEISQALCQTAGLPAYEVSNHAKPGFESQHNLIYWQSGDYLGVGPGAHGRITIEGQRFETTSEMQPLRWLKDCDADSGSVLSALNREDWSTEHLLMGLRLNKPYDMSLYTAISGHNINQKSLNKLNEFGLIEFVDESILVTATGRLVLNHVILELLSG